MRRVSIGLCLLALAALLAFAAWGWGALYRPYAGWEGPAADVWIEPGLDAGTLLGRLSAAGVIRHPRLVRVWLMWHGGSERLHAGEYRFERPMSPVEVVGRLSDGSVVLHPVTLPEGLNLQEAAQRLSDTGLGSYDDLLASFSDPTPILDIDPEAVDLEGYLYPETYKFPRGEQPERIAQAMVRRFKDAVGVDFAERAARVGLNVRGAVILASMIEKETSVPEERARISRVFHNRLERGMKLECDPTVVYALMRAGRPVRRLALEDLSHASPWNTYQVPGLPAGPIGSPGGASLLAAVTPSSGSELYFVADPRGGHRFSGTLAEHLDAVQAWRLYVKSSR